MKKILWSAVLIGLAISLAGCSGPASTVRERATKFTQLLLDDKFDEAVDFYDPDYVTAKGRTTVAATAKFVVNIAKGIGQFTGRKTAGFEVRKVDLDSQKTSASVQIVYFTTDSAGGDRKEMPTDQRWILKNRTWYVAR